MKREDLKNVATPDLAKKYKLFKIAFFILSAIVAFMFFIGYVTWKDNGFSATVLLPICFVPMVVINYINCNKIKKELASRN